MVLGNQSDEFWLGGLDSNQDSQLQRLMYYRLYDLPAEGGEANGPCQQEIFVAARPSLFTLVRIRESVNRALDDLGHCEIH